MGQNANYLSNDLHGNGCYGPYLINSFHGSSCYRTDTNNHSLATIAVVLLWKVS